MEVIPAKDSPSDDEWVVSFWHVEHHSQVKRGDPLVDVETTKSTLEVEAPADGYVHRLAQVGDRLPFGAAVAAISDQTLNLAEPLSEVPPSDVSGTGADQESYSSSVLSNAAAELLAEVRLNVQHLEGRLRGLVSKNQLAGVLARELMGNALTQARWDGSALVLLGGGGHAAALIDLIRELRVWRIAGIYDSNQPLGSDVCGIPVLGDDRELPRAHELGVRLCVNGVGGVRRRGDRRAAWQKIVDAGMGLPILVHPRASIDQSAVLAQGVQVFAQATIGARAVVDEDAIVNSGAVLSHDAKLGAHSHLSPGALVAGGAEIGSDALIGMAATVFMNAEVPDETVIPNNVSINLP